MQRETCWTLLGLAGYRRAPGASAKPFGSVTTSWLRILGAQANRVDSESPLGRESRCIAKEVCERIHAMRPGGTLGAGRGGQHAPARETLRCQSGSCTQVLHVAQSQDERSRNT